MKSKKFIIGIAIFVFIAGFSGWYIYRDLKGTQETPESQGPSLRKEVSPEEQQAALLKKQEEIKNQMPDLDREILINVQLSTETRLKAISEIGTIKTALKEDFDRREEWLNLGIWYKTIGDYEGAEQAWKFVTLIRPEDPVAYHNLGDLYSQYMTDLAKAEMNYKLAIEKDTSHHPFFYTKLFDFYRYYAKKPDLAEKTLVDALETNPGDTYLQSLLEDYRNELRK